MTLTEADFVWTSGDWRQRTSWGGLQEGEEDTNDVYWRGEMCISSCLTAHQDLARTLTQHCIKA